MIVSCGEALIDFIPAVRGAEAGYVPRPGGSPCNVAVGVARLGVPAGFLGALSTDLFGDMLAGHLDANHVSQRFVRRLDRPSTLGFVSLPGGGEPRYAFYGEGAADRNLTPDLVPDDLGDEVEALHVGSFSLAVQPVAGTLHRLLERESARRFVSLDPNVRPGLVGGHAAYLWTLESVITHADLVKVSRADLDWLYPGAPLGEVAVHWMSLGPRLVVVTLGGDGAVALRNDGTVQMPSEPVSVVDTVGAGDAFMAGLLAELHGLGRLSADGLDEMPEPELRRCLKLANRVAGMTCARAGANPPLRAELDA